MCIFVSRMVVQCVMSYNTKAVLFLVVVVVVVVVVLVIVVVVIIVVVFTMDYQR